MSYAEYWEGSPDLARYYREAFVMKQKREARTDDYNAWLNGMYIHEAIASIFCSSESNKYVYPGKPYLGQKAEQDRLTPEEKEEKQIAAELAFHRNLMQKYGKKDTAES